MSFLSTDHLTGRKKTQSDFLPTYIEVNSFTKFVTEFSNHFTRHRTNFAILSNERLIIRTSTSGTRTHNFLRKKNLYLNMCLSIITVMRSGLTRERGRGIGDG